MPKTLLPRIFVTLAAPNFGCLELLAERASASPVGFELRLDHLKENANWESELHTFLTRLHSPPTIATCRRVEAGGLFTGSVNQQVAMLRAAARAGCQWVDVEIESVARAGAEILRQFKPAKVIVSYHNYKKSPDLSAVYRRLSRLPADIVKVATHARALRDNLKVARLLKAHHRRRPKLVALALGASGIPSRLLGLRWGSHFTYASAGNNLNIAPGQIPVDLMRSVYRVEQLNRRTQIFGVIGSRAAISLSPPMQNAAFQAKQANAVYLPCETEHLGDFLEFARQLSFLGFSVTMPFKRAIIRHLDWLDPLATQIGACNTVAVQRGRWMGWNTDAAAVVEVLTKRLRLAGSRVLVLGAGGASRAAAYALRAEGAEVILSARRDFAARRLARSISAQTVEWSSGEELDIDAVVNATPVGMAPHAESMPVDLSRLRVRVVFDMVYHPLETRLLAEARRRGLTTISGLEMLVAQGARQFEIWTGKSAPRALMEQAIRQMLGEQH